jgi:hypothetical protein
VKEGKKIASREKGNLLRKKKNKVERRYKEVVFFE